MKCWEEVLANDQNATCSICNGEVQEFQHVYGVDLAPGRGDDGGSDEGTKGLSEKASCYVKRCGKFVKRAKGDCLTIVDLFMCIQLGLAIIFYLASWGFATFNLASNTNWNTVIPSPQTLLKFAESIVEFLLMYFCAFIFVGLLIISWM